MNKCQLISDQLYTWSEYDVGCSDNSAQTSAQATAEEAAAARRCSSRLIDRAIQALWQARLQMRQGSGTRTEVLFVGEPNWGSTGNGLRAAGYTATSSSIPGQLPSDPRHSRSALRDQSRVAPSPGTVLGIGGEHVDHNPHRHFRYHCRCDADDQHARGVAARAWRFPLTRGGTYR